MIDVINDVVFFTDVVGGADNPDRFVESNINEIFLRCAYRFVVYCYDISGHDFGAHFGYLPIDHDPSAFNELVCSPTRAIANFTEVFIDADAFCLVHYRLRFDGKGTEFCRPWLLIPKNRCGLQFSDAANGEQRAGNTDGGRNNEKAKFDGG